MYQSTQTKNNHGDAMSVMTPSLHWLYDRPTVLSDFPDIRNYTQDVLPWFKQKHPEMYEKIMKDEFSAMKKSSLVDWEDCMYDSNNNEQEAWANWLEESPEVLLDHINSRYPTGEAYSRAMHWKVATDDKILTGDWVYIFPTHYESRPYYGLGRVSYSEENGGAKKVIYNEGEMPPILDYCAMPKLDGSSPKLIEYSGNVNRYC